MRSTSEHITIIIPFIKRVSSQQPRRRKKFCANSLTTFADNNFHGQFQDKPEIFCIKDKLGIKEHSTKFSINKFWEFFLHDLTARKTFTSSFSCRTNILVPHVRIVARVKNYNLLLDIHLLLWLGVSGFCCSFFFLMTSSEERKKLKQLIFGNVLVVACGQKFFCMIYLCKKNMGKEWKKLR